ncbi:MAG: hypothetical protein ACOYKE_02785 [Ferruginibacter sp.]
MFVLEIEMTITSVIRSSPQEILFSGYHFGCPISLNSHIFQPQANKKMIFNFTSPIRVLFLSVFLTTVSIAAFANVTPVRSNFSYNSITNTIHSSIEVINGRVIIQWDIENSPSVNYFEIERSYDKSQFLSCGLALGAFEKDNQLQYKFKENASILDTHQVVYYRLKQYNNDGSFIYSSIMELKGQCSPSTSLPNASLK